MGDLLDISRAITGKIRISSSQIDLVNVVEFAIEGIRPAAEAKRLSIEAALSSGTTIIRGDGDRLQQVVWNPLANAVEDWSRALVEGFNVHMEKPVEPVVLVRAIIELVGDFRR